jgi:hypothetical protein
VEFTHGFPRKLSARHASHGGFLKGNVVAGAKATNQSLRRLAIHDIACLTARHVVEGSGLALAKLINLRWVKTNSKNSIRILE